MEGGAGGVFVVPVAGHETGAAGCDFAFASLGKRREPFSSRMAISTSSRAFPTEERRRRRFSTSSACILRVRWSSGESMVMVEAVSVWPKALMKRVWGRDFDGLFG